MLYSLCETAVPLRENIVTLERNLYEQPLSGTKKENLYCEESKTDRRVKKTDCGFTV